MKTMCRVVRVAVFFLVVSMLLTAVPVTTEAKSANRIELSGKSKMTLYKGESMSISVKGIYQNGKKISGNQKSIWKKLKVNSSKKSVAVVSKDGTITAKKKGQTTISISLASNKKVKTSIKLTVKSVSGKPSITLNKKSASLELGETTTIKVKSVKGLSSKSVTFKSDDEYVATVDKNGKVTAKGSGEASIIVTSATNKKVRATFEVVVDEEEEYDCSVNGHVWGEWYAPERMNSAICFAPYLVRQCLECDAQERQDAPVDEAGRVKDWNHDWEFVEHRDASRGVTGGDVYRCKNDHSHVCVKNAFNVLPTEEEALNSIMALKSVYPTGTPDPDESMNVPIVWAGDDENYSCGSSTGTGCAGFALLLSNAAFGEGTLFKTHHDASKVRIGDIIEFDGDSIHHWVIVIGFTADGGWITAEGNVGGKVSWSEHARKMVGSDLYTASSAGAGEIQNDMNIDSRFYGLQSHNTKINVYTRWY